MDIATLIGIIFGLGAIVGSILLMTPDMGMFVSASSFGIVFGGMLASVAVAFPLKDVLQLGTAIGAVFKGGRDTLGGLVDEAVEAAEAGRKGTADLEKHIESIGSFFFKDGVQMVIDGYSLEEITEILNTRIDYRELRENTQAGLFKSMGVMAPAWGMVGTLIGLVVMLSGFGGEGGGTDTLGSGMSAALITTMYGAIFANLFFLPMADKIKTRITSSSTEQNLQLEAARLIHQKKHPIIVREKLNSFIPPKEWKKKLNNYACNTPRKKKFIAKGMEQVEEGLPGWFGTFADMMTLLFAFFVLLAAISTIDPVKLQNMADSMGKSVGTKGNGQSSHVIGRHP